jgi:acetyl-CoA carboxylase biotin carboxyl carrier protein
MGGLTGRDVDRILAMVDRILAFAERGQSGEIDLTVGDAHLVVRLGKVGKDHPAPAEPRSTEPPKRDAGASGKESDAPSSHGESVGAAQGHAVASPLAGAFFRAPRPGAPPFVKPGDRVEPDTVIGIVELMKLMNPIPAGVAGEVLEIVAQDGATVQTGDTLIIVRPA